MEKWFVETKRADFNQIAAKFQISPIVARLLRNREILDEKGISLFLYGNRDNLYDPFLMKDMQKGVTLMDSLIREKKKIRIIGDYDIDGVCSSYILEQGLRAAGADVDVVIPHRMKDGYGLNDHLIEQAAESGREAIITCDNGIAALPQIMHAKELGMVVIVTDHHEVPYDEEDGKRIYRLPPADAVIDPKQEDCAYPFSGICGAVVAYKFIKALFLHKKMKDSALLEECFGFAAFATVGDVMELLDENHILVKYGLHSIENSRNPGLQALIEQCGLKDKPLSPYHIGFVLGPCFNASGRLDTADRVLELLNCQTKREAMVIAAELRNLNEERQELTVQGLEEAIALVEKKQELPKVLVIYQPMLHESLAGIIAGRLREKYHRPVFVLTDGEDGIKGSGRSIDAYHMYDEMTKIKDIFVKYGGHKLAAGLSLPPGKADEFEQRINEVCELGEEDFHERIMIDVAMPLSHVSRELMEQLKMLEPYGTGNRRPLFAQKKVELVGAKVFGKNRNVVKGTVKSPDGASFDAIYFGDGDAFCRQLKESGNLLDITYTPAENTFRGITTLQIEIKNVKFAYTKE